MSTNIYIFGTKVVPVAVKPWIIKGSSLVAWNPRSLFSIGGCSKCPTISYVSQLCKTHTFAGLADRNRQLKVSPNCPMCSHVRMHSSCHTSTGIPGLVFWAAAFSHLQLCSEFGCHAAVEGRILHFWSDSTRGSFDVFFVYFDPG